MEKVMEKVMDHKIEEFVKISDQNKWTGIMAIGDETCYNVCCFGQPEVQLMLLASLIKSFRIRAGEDWDEIEYKLDAYMDDLKEVEEF